MPTIGKSFEHALLAQAAYINLEGIDSADRGAVSDAAITQRILPKPLADEMFLTGPVTWHVAGAPHHNDTRGYAATLFESSRGDRVLAVRGTEVTSLDQVVQDVLRADLAQIGRLGVALDQAVSLFNHVERLTAEAGRTDVLQVSPHTGTVPPDGVPSVPLSGAPGAAGDGPGIHLWLEASFDGTGAGAVPDGARLDVTGHSLGGHLAALAVRLFPDRVGEGFTFNAPGFDAAASAGLTDEVVGLFAAFRPVAPSFAAVAGRIHTLESEGSAPGDDLDLVSGAFAGAPPGPEVPVATEVNSHAMGQLVDALAVQNLFATLDPGLTGDAAAGLLAAASADPAAAEERLVSKLADLLGAPLAGSGGIPVSSATLLRAGDLADREGLHAAVLAVAAADGFSRAAGQGVEVVPLAGVAPGELAGRAASDVSYRYALDRLDPFTISGDAALFAAHGTGGALDPVDPSTGRGAMSAEYLRERSRFLARLLERNAAGATVADPGPGGAPAYYRDLPSGLELFARAPLTPPVPDRMSQFLFGGPGVDAVTGGRGDDVLFGGGGGDVLHAGSGADFVSGDGGDDFLYAGGGPGSDDGAADDLHGGAGLDRYVAGDGDRILDLDGIGRVLFGETLLTGGTRVPGTSRYTGPDPGVAYLRDPAGGGLTVTGPAGVLSILGFENGDLGIELAEAEAPPPPGADVTGSDGPDRMETRDLGPGVRSVSSLDGDDEVFVDTGVTPVIAVAAGPGDDQVVAASEHRDPVFPLLFRPGVEPGPAGPGVSLRGEAGDDLLLGGLQDDRLAGGPGHDLVHGSAGRDAVAGDGGNDWLEGQEGPDDLLGGPGTDRLLGGAGIDYLAGGDGADDLYGDGVSAAAGWDGDVPALLDAVAPGVSYLHRDAADAGIDVLDGGPGDDRLWGGGGDDELIGGPGDDLLLGEAGDDVLLGGPGRDTLLGDRESTQADLDAGVLARGSVPSGGEFEVRRRRPGPDTPGADTLVGGPGDDDLWGVGGPDGLLGGEGDDVLVGGPGGDRLLGEAGDDTLFGGPDDDDVRGGPGADILAGGDGSDRYRFAPGAGHDVLLEEDGDGVVAFEGGIGAADVTVRRDGANLVLEYGGGDSLRVSGWYDAPERRLARVEFSDGGSADGAALGRAALAVSVARPDGNLAGLAGEDDRLTGGAGANALSGLGGDDLLVGLDGDDLLRGGPGSDRLEGGPGADRLDGGAGDDWLLGGEGPDTYEIGPGSGFDAVVDHTPGAGVDVLRLAPGIPAGALVATPEGNDLSVRLPGGDGVSIREYRLRPGSWIVETASGARHPLETLLAPPAGGAGTVAAERARFREREFAARSAPATAVLDVGDPFEGAVAVTFAPGASGIPNPVLSRDRDGGAGLDGADFATVLRHATRPGTVPVLAVDGVNATRGETRVAVTERAGTAGADTFVPAGPGTEFAFDTGTVPVYLSVGPAGGTGGVAGAGLAGDPYALPILSSGFEPPAGVAAADFTGPIDRIGDVVRIEVSLDRVTHRMQVYDGGAGNDRLGEFDPTGTGRDAGVLILDGGPGNDALRGGRDADFLSGGPGDDVLFGFAGRDVLAGGSGEDFLLGGEQPDRYLAGFEGAGTTTIVDAGRFTADFDRGLVFEFFSIVNPDLTFERLDGLFHVVESRGEFILGAMGLPVEEDGILEAIAPGVTADLVREGLAPDAAAEVTASLTGIGEHFGRQFAPFTGGGGTILDLLAPGDDVLRIDAAWTDVEVAFTGSADAPSLVLTRPGAPGARVVVDGRRAGEPFGAGVERFEFTDRTLDIAEIAALAAPAGNRPPRVEATLPDRDLPADLRFAIALPDGTFVDPDPGDVLSLTAGAADGGPLPDWLEFAPGPGILSGFPVAGEAGPLDVVFTATDAGGATASVTFSLNVIPAPASRVLTGTARGDRLRGGDAGEVITGGGGRDHLLGGGGDDTFRLEGEGPGVTLVRGGPGVDTVLGGPGDDAIRLRGLDRRASVEVVDGGGGENVLLGTAGPDRFDFTGTALRRIRLVDAGPGRDRIVGSSGDDVLFGGDGADRIDGGAGADRLVGGPGPDVLGGRPGSPDHAGDGGRVGNVYEGGPGDDLLRGTRGPDTYFFASGDGSDRIVESGGDGAVDRVQFGGGLAADRLWFSAEASDLLISAIGGADRLVVAGWYDGPEHRVEEFRLTSGPVLVASRVQGLVDAMAAFAPPGAGDAGPAVEVREVLEPVLAAAWES